jgi:cytoskeletal protein CcmA (bactofilin family)
MGIAGKSLVVIGEVRSTSELTLDGRIEGHVWCENGSVTVSASAVLMGDVVARDITVLGRVSGQLIATEVVDVRAGAVVTGAAIAPAFILHEGASFNGRVEPQRLDAALGVARFQQKQRDTKAG